MALLVDRYFWAFFQIDDVFPSFIYKKLRSTLSVWCSFWNYSNIELLVFKVIIRSKHLLNYGFCYLCDPIALFQRILEKQGLQPKVWNFKLGRNLALDLAFDTISLRSICERDDVAIGELGPAVAETLKHRLSDLRAATSVYDLIVGHPRILENAENPQLMAIDICNDYRIIFCANHQRNPAETNGNIDWQKVSRVKILRIERSLC